jgi:hypothetical protein
MLFLVSFASAKRRRERAREKMICVESTNERPKRNNRPAAKYSPEPPKKRQKTSTKQVKGKSKDSGVEKAPSIPKPVVSRRKLIGVSIYYAKVLYL